MLLATDSSQVTHPSTMPTPAFHPLVYAHNMYEICYRHALWVPEPYGSIPAYLAAGVRIGDVGYVTSSGGFHTLFNICLPANDPVNYGRVPPGFEQLHIPPAAINRISVYYQRNATIVNAQNTGKTAGFDVGVTDPMTQLLGAGASVEYTWRNSEGAILHLPNGATRFEAPPGLFKEYIKRHAYGWDTFINIDQGYNLPPGSIYLVTSCDKTEEWMVGAFHQNSVGREVSLGISALGLVEGGVAFAYRYDRASPLICRDHVRGPEGDSAGVMTPDGSEAHCVFFQGFRITVTDRAKRKVKVKAKLVDELSSERLGWIQRGLRSHMSSSSTLSFTVDNSATSSTPSTRSCSQEPESSSETESAYETDSETESITSDDDSIDIEDFPMDWHPSVRWNEHLLDKFPDAMVAFTHDQDIIRINEGIMDEAVCIDGSVFWDFVAQPLIKDEMGSMDSAHEETWEFTFDCPFTTELSTSPLGHSLELEDAENEIDPGGLASASHQKFDVVRCAVCRSGIDPNQTSMICVRCTGLEVDSDAPNIGLKATAAQDLDDKNSFSRNIAKVAQSTEHPTHAAKLPELNFAQVVRQQSGQSLASTSSVFPKRSTHHYELATASGLDSTPAPRKTPPAENPALYYPPESDHPSPFLDHEHDNHQPAFFAPDLPNYIPIMLESSDGFYSSYLPPDLPAVPAADRLNSLPRPRLSRSRRTYPSPFVRHALLHPSPPGENPRGYSRAAEAATTHSQNTLASPQWAGYLHWSEQEATTDFRKNRTAIPGTKAAKLIAERARYSFRDVESGKVAKESTEDPKEAERVSRWTIGPDSIHLGNLKEPAASVIFPSLLRLPMLKIKGRPVPVAPSPTQQTTTLTAQTLTSAPTVFDHLRTVLESNEHTANVLLPMPLKSLPLEKRPRPVPDQYWIVHVTESLMLEVDLCIPTRRVCSALAQRPVSEAFVELLTQAAGIPPVLNPYCESWMSYCTAGTFMPRFTWTSFSYKMRPADKSDVEETAELCRLFAADCEPFVMAFKEVEILIKNGRFGVCCVVEDGPSHIAFICAMARSSEITPTTTEVFTSPKFWRRGRIEHLVRCVCEYSFRCKKDAASVVYPRVGIDNPAHFVCFRIGSAGLMDNNPRSVDAGQGVELEFDRAKVDLAVTRAQDQPVLG